MVAVLDVGSTGTSDTDAQNYFGNHPDEKPAVTSVQFHPQKIHLVIVGVEDGRLLLWNWKANVAKEVVALDNLGACPPDAQ